MTEVCVAQGAGSLTNSFKQHHSSVACIYCAHCIARGTTVRNDGFNDAPTSDPSPWLYSLSATSAFSAAIRQMCPASASAERLCVASMYSLPAPQRRFRENSSCALHMAEPPGPRLVRIPNFKRQDDVHRYLPCCSGRKARLRIVLTTRP